MSRTDRIRRIIAEQKGRGAFSIDDWIRARAWGNTEQEQNESIEFCHEIIEAVPTVFDRVRQVAEERGFSTWVEPLVAHAEDYFLQSEDLLPESKLGSFGLLDDAYVALRVVNLVQSERDPLLEVDLNGPLDFLRQVLGEEITGKLDQEVVKAQQRMHERMRQLQEAARRRAEAERQAERERRRASPRAPAPARPAPGSDRQQCMACSGSGRVTCSSCYGHGYQTQSYSRVDWEGNVEYVTDQIPCGCSGGYTICGSCGGSGWK